MYLEKYLMFFSLFFTHLEKHAILLLSINESKSNIKKQSASNLAKQLKFHESVDQVISKSNVACSTINMKWMMVRFSLSNTATKDLVIKPVMYVNNMPR